MNEMIFIFEDGMMLGAETSKFIEANKDICFFEDKQIEGCTVVEVIADKRVCDKADVIIAYGEYQYISDELMEIATHAIYDDIQLVYFLKCILNGYSNEMNTVVISCAGMGTRLGLGCTKALVKIDEKSLIERHLDILTDCKDVRIVVGYQARQVIDLVVPKRKNVIFAFNHEYASTGTGASFMKGINFGAKYGIALDGDLLVHPDDFMKVLEYDGSAVCGTTPSSDDAWLIPVAENKGVEYALGFNQEDGKYEWTGLAKMETAKVELRKRHVFHLAEPLLPMPLIYIRTKEIDTMGDYERAAAWVHNGYED